MAFPTVALLDSFQRANEKPLSNSTKWVLLGGMVKTGEIKSEAWNATSTFGSEDGAYWKVKEASGEIGVACEYDGSLSLSRFLRLWSCVSNPGSATLISGYSLKIVAESSTKVKLLIEKVTEAGFTTLKEKTAVTIAVGDRLGIAVQSGVVTAWLKKGAGAWEQLLEHSDSTYKEGYVGFSAQGNLHKWRNFEASISSTEFKEEKTVAQGSSASLSKTINRTLKASNASSPTLSKTKGSQFLLFQGSNATLKLKQAVQLLRAYQATVALLLHETETFEESEEEELKREFPYPQVFMCGPGLISSYQEATPEWEPDLWGPKSEFGAVYIKTYEKYNQWDDGTGTPGSADEGGAVHVEDRFGSEGGVTIQTRYLINGHVPAGAVYDAGPRKLKGITLTFPVVGYAAQGTSVLVRFFNPTVPQPWEPFPESEPGYVIPDGYMATITTIKDSKGNLCYIMYPYDIGGIVEAVIRVGGPGTEPELPGGALEPGDTITITLAPGPLAGPLQKVIPDDVGLPVTVEVWEVREGEGETKLSSHVEVVPPGQGMQRAFSWGGPFGMYPYATQWLGFSPPPEPPLPWADGTEDPMDGFGVMPHYYKAVPVPVGVYCHASVIDNSAGQSFALSEPPIYTLTANTAKGSSVFHLTGAAKKGLRVGDEAQFVSFASGSGLTGDGLYVVGNPDDDSFEVAHYLGGPPIKAASEIVGSKTKVRAFGRGSGQVHGSAPLNQSIQRSPTHDEGVGVYVVTDWTGATAPEGGEYENFLNAVSHGNHMIVDYRWYGAGGEYRAEGAGEGWLDVKQYRADWKPPNFITSGTVSGSTHEEPDTTFGIGPKGGPGRVITVEVHSTSDSVADANSKHSKRTTDNADLWWYFNWMNGLYEGNKTELLSSANWATSFGGEIKRLYAEAPGGSVFNNLKRVGPRLAELRIFFQVDGHTNPHWKMWNREGEDAFTARFGISTVLFGSNVSGELFEEGVLIGKEVPLRTATDATGGVEFVLRQAIPAFPIWEWYYFKEDPKEAEGSLLHPGKEPFGLISMVPLLHTIFNTLTFNWSAEFRLYFPPPVAKEEEELRIERNGESQEEAERIEKEHEKQHEKEEEEEQVEREHEEEREREREEEREQEEEAEEEPGIKVDTATVPSARVPSNKVVGRRAENPTAEEQEGDFSEIEEGGEGEGGGEVEGGLTAPSVSVELWPEGFLSEGPWVGLWCCLKASEHSGYRVRWITSAEGGNHFDVNLERVTAGVPTVLASTALEAAEAFATLALSAEGGTVVVSWAGSTILSHADATYTSGKAGIEGTGALDFGLTHFKQGGEELDDLLRSENPLAKEPWTKLPWAFNIGRCYNGFYGWVPAIEPIGGTSGAYWNA